MSKEWICPDCGEKHECVRFSCVKCKAPPKGEIGNVRFVSRDEGFEEMDKHFYKIVKGMSND